MKSLDHCRGEKRLALAVVIRALKDLIKFLYPNSNSNDILLTKAEIRKTVYWVLSSDYSQISFRYYIDMGTKDVEEMDKYAYLSRTLALKVKKHIDSN